MRDHCFYKIKSKQKKKEAKPCMMLPMEYHRQSMIKRKKMRLPVWQAVKTKG